MLTENDIAPELEQYQEFNKAYQSGKRDSDLPGLPKNKDEQQSRLSPVFGVMIHPVLSFFVWISSFVRAYWFVGLLSRARIATDGLSYEPKSCGLHKAYTNLGLSFLAQHNLSGAIICLDASWRVHPCPHNCSFGLSRDLVSKLKHYPEASEVVQEYIRIGKKFIIWSENWAHGI